MHTKIDILDNTLEQMLADAEDHGRDGIQPMLTPEDVATILKGLRALQKGEMKAVVSDDTEHCSPYRHTVDGMLSANYKERFKAEYIQTKIRYEKLKAFCNKLEATDRSQYGGKRVFAPDHDCPFEMLREQQEVMGHYLHILEVRAVIEGVDLC